MGINDNGAEGRRQRARRSSKHNSPTRITATTCRQSTTTIATVEWHRICQNKSNKKRHNTVSHVLGFEKSAPMPFIHVNIHVNIHFTDVSWTRLRSMSAPCHEVHVNIHFTDVSWTRLRSMSAPCHASTCQHSFHRRVMDEASIHVGPHAMHSSCQHSFHRRVMDEASIHVGPHAMKYMSTFISQTCHGRGFDPCRPPCHAVHVNIHFTDVSWTRLRSMSAPMPFIHVNIISQTCHGRGFDPCRPPCHEVHVNIHFTDVS